VIAQDDNKGKVQIKSKNQFLANNDSLKQSFRKMIVGDDLQIFSCIFPKLQRIETYAIVYLCCVITQFEMVIHSSFILFLPFSSC